MFGWSRRLFLQGCLWDWTDRGSWMGGKASGPSSAGSARGPAAEGGRNETPEQQGGDRDTSGSPASPRKPPGA